MIDLCSVSQSKNDTLSEGKESVKQESLGQIETRRNGQNGSQIKDHDKRIHDQKG